MTQNQIDYAKLLETRRSNRAQEAQTSRRDQRAYEVNFFNAQETQRANLERERYNRSDLAEKHRANRAKEQQAVNELAERQRYNSLNIGLGYSQLAETERANKERERETHRTNQVNENIDWANAYAHRTEAAAKKKANELKADEIALNERKFEHQQSVDNKNLWLDSRRVALQEQHQIAVDPAYVLSQGSQAAKNFASSMRDMASIANDIIPSIIDVFGLEA